MDYGKIKVWKYPGDFFHTPDWIFEEMKRGVIYNKNSDPVTEGLDIYIKTLEGDQHVSLGDYIIKDVRGEVYSYKPDVFERTFKPVNN